LILILVGIFFIFVFLVATRNFTGTLPFPRWLPPVVILGLALLGSTFTIVPAGHVGVQVLFGKVYPEILPEGLHIINPLISVKDMSIRTQEVFEHAESPSREGLNVVLEASLLYHVNPEAAARLYQQVGPHYDQVVLMPQFRSAIRGVTVQHEAKDLYTSGWEMIANQIAEDLKKNMADRGLILEQVLLRRITLPQMVEEAINDKLAAEQQAQRMQFVLAKRLRKQSGSASRPKVSRIFRTLSPKACRNHYCAGKASKPLNIWLNLPMPKLLSSAGGMVCP
jgi:prohibitin 1